MVKPSTWHFGDSILSLQSFVLGLKGAPQDPQPTGVVDTMTIFPSYALQARGSSGSYTTHIVADIRAFKAVILTGCVDTTVRCYHRQQRPTDTVATDCASQVTILRSVNHNQNSKLHSCTRFWAADSVKRNHEGRSGSLRLIQRVSFRP